MIALLCFFLTLFASPFKSKSRLEAENDPGGMAGYDPCVAPVSMENEDTKLYLFCGLGHCED
jgi:hypothetical protein